MLSVLRSTLRFEEASRVDFNELDNLVQEKLGSEKYKELFEVGVQLVDSADIQKVEQYIAEGSRPKPGSGSSSAKNSQLAKMNLENPFASSGILKKRMKKKTLSSDVVDQQ